MLENEAVLRTWRLSHPPDAGGEIPAEPLPPHRLAYLDYEGPVSGNRGQVTRWDRGTYTTLVDDAGRIEIELQGSKLHGRAVLVVEAGTERFYFTSSTSDS